MDTFWHDLRYALRTLRSTPGFTAVAVLTLALGIGATTSIFSLVNAALLRPLPYRDADQLVVLNETDPRVGDVSVSYPDFLDWRAQAHSFSEMAAANNVGVNFSGTATSERVAGYGVSANFLSMLGVRPLLGRDFEPEEEKKGTAPVVLLSYKLWQSHFGGDPDALGKAVDLDGKSYVIVGVLPAGFKFLSDVSNADFLAPIGVFVNDDLMDRGSHGDLTVIARLSPGVTLAQAKGEMLGLQTELAQKYSGAKDNEKNAVDVRTLRDVIVSGARPELLVLFAAVGFVLLIACVNVANLYLVRAAGRAKEIAVRLALGASRGRMVRQILTECSVIAVAGGGLGILLGVLGIDGLTKILPMGMFQDLGTSMDRTVLAFAAGVIIFMTFAFGLVPAFTASRGDVQDALKEGGRSSSAGMANGRLRAAFAVAEIALAMVLLIGAGLMVKSLYRLLHVDGGFRTDNILSMEVELDGTRYAHPPQILNFWQQSLDKIRAIPGVKIAAVGTVIPLTDDHSRTDITFAGLPTPARGAYPHPDYHVVSAGYIEALGIPLLRGRAFTEADNENSPFVAIVNQKIAERYFPGQDVIGKQFTWGHIVAGRTPKWITIVGVVGDTKLYGLANPSRFEVYVPYRQDDEQDMHFIIRGAVDAGSLAPAVRSAIASVDRDQPAFGVSTFSQMLDDSVSDRRMTLILLSIFSGFALLLAGVGIYGVIAYSAARRTQEIGIRIALGAQRVNILRLVLGESIGLAVLGVGIGAAAAFGLTRLMSALLYSVSTSDPLTYIGVAAVITLVALAASWVPARRAMRVDPMIALRYE
jgi:putative ABC transport system permease protein